MRCAPSASPVTNASRTFMWNNAEHLAAYLAVPSMGAVLHTLNIRLSPEQIAFIANEAEDQVIVADLSLTAQLAAVLPLLDTVHTVIAVGDGDLGAAGAASGKTVLRYDDVLAGAVARRSTGPMLDETRPPRCATPAAPPEIRKVLSTAIVRAICTAMSTCTANTLGIGAEDSVLPIVPMFHANAWGLPYAALMAGADLVLTDRFLDAKSIIDLIETQRPTWPGAVPTIWNDVHALPGNVTGSRHLVAAAGVVRRIGRAACR